MKASAHIQIGRIDHLGWTIKLYLSEKGVYVALTSRTYYTDEQTRSRVVARKVRNTLLIQAIAASINWIEKQEEV